MTLRHLEEYSREAGAFFDKDRLCLRVAVEVETWGEVLYLVTW